MNVKEIINSVGIEMEFMNVNRKDPNFQLTLRDNLENYKLEHDASCETPIQSFANYPITFTSKKAKNLLSKFTSEIIIGGEIVSPIINTLSPKWITEIHNLCNLLIQHGETENTLRDSFHVHINLSKEVPLFVLTNLLKFCIAYEAFLYRLGGMGRMNRGEENQFIFCRPYLENGPPVIKLAGKNYPILNTWKLLNATSKEDFFNFYGDSLLYDARTKYVTQRYMCVNFYPILTQGSIEFRTANKTLNPHFIIAWTNFCKAIVTKSFSEPKIELDRIRPLAENRNIETNEFLSAINILNLDNPTKNILQAIWETSPTPKFDNNWRYSHLDEPTKFINIKHAPEALPPKTKIQTPKYVNVRNVNRQQNAQVPPPDEPMFRLQVDEPVINDLEQVIIENNAIMVARIRTRWLKENQEFTKNGGHDEVIHNRIFNIVNLNTLYPTTNMSIPNYEINLQVIFRNKEIKVKLYQELNQIIHYIPTLSFQELFDEYILDEINTILDIQGLLVYIQEKWDIF